MTLTPTELLELKFLVKRLEEDSKDRERCTFRNNGMTANSVIRITEKAKDAERVLPILRKIISSLSETSNSHSTVNTGPYPKPDWSTDL